MWLGRGWFERWKNWSADHSRETKIPFEPEIPGESSKAWRIRNYAPEDGFEIKKNEKKSYEANELFF